MLTSLRLRSPYLDTNYHIFNSQNVIMMAFTHKCSFTNLNPTFATCIFTKAHEVWAFTNVLLHEKPSTRILYFPSPHTLDNKAAYLPQS